MKRESFGAPVPVLALREAWAKWFTESSFPYDVGHCINGTSTAIEVLAEFGLRAKPVSVSVALFNKQAWVLFNDGVPVEEWPEFAWSVGIGPGHGLPPNPDRWSGHLMAEGVGWTLDISSMQWNRPGKLNVTKPWVMPALPADKPLAVADAAGQVLVTSRWNANDGWRGAGGWRRTDRPIINEAVRRTEKELKLL